MFPADCAARFRPERALGSGGYGAVWLAHDLKLDRQAAVKLLHAEAAEDREQVARFEQEARITARLAHPHIVAVLDAGAAQGVPWIAYELLEGKTLADVAGRLPVPGALAAIMQVALALDAAHAAGVLHRDVKPANVLSAGDGHWKVADFGIARCGSDSRVKTATGVLMGTPVYMAPEQVNGAGAAVSSDLYALGISLYEVLTGEPPFFATAPLKVLQMHLTESPRPPSMLRPEIGPELDRLVLRSIEKEPRARFASAGAFAQALAAALDGAGSATPAAPRRAQPGRKTHEPSTLPASRLHATMPVALSAPGSRRSLALVAAGVVLAIGLGVALRPAPPPVERTPPPAALTTDPPPAPRHSLEKRVIAYLRELQPLGGEAVRDHQRPGMHLAPRPALGAAYTALIERGAALAPEVYALPDDDPVKMAFAGSVADLVPIGRAVDGGAEARVMRERLRDWTRSTPQSVVARVPLTISAPPIERYPPEQFRAVLDYKAPRGSPELVAGWVRLRYRIARVYENQDADPDGIVRRRTVQDAIEACDRAGCMNAILDVDAKLTLGMDDHDMRRGTILLDRIRKDGAVREQPDFKSAIRGLWHDLGRRARLHLDAYDALHVATLLARHEWIELSDPNTRKVERDMEPLWKRFPGARALLHALRGVQLKLGPDSTKRLEDAVQPLLDERPPREVRSLRDAYRARRWCSGLLEIARQLRHRERPEPARRCLDAVRTTLALNLDVLDLAPEHAALAELDRENPERPEATNPR